MTMTMMMIQFDGGGDSMAMTRVVSMTSVTMVVVIRVVSMASVSMAVR